MVFGWKSSPEWRRYYDELKQKRAGIAAQRMQIEMNHLLIEAKQEALRQMFVEQEKGRE